MSSAGQNSAFPSESRQSPRSPAPGPRCRCLAVIYPLIGRVRSHGDARTDSPDRSLLVPQDWPKVCGYARTLPNRSGSRPTARVRGSPAAGLTAQLQRSRGVVRGPAGANGRTCGSPCRVRRNPSRPPILGSSRAGATIPPEAARSATSLLPTQLVRLAERRGRPSLEDRESQWSGAPMGPSRVGGCSGSDAGRRYPTRTAAAITVVQSPFLSPTAVWVTFWVRTIWFESR